MSGWLGLSVRAGSTDRVAVTVRRLACYRINYTCHVPTSPFSPARRAPRIEMMMALVLWPLALLPGRVVLRAATLPRAATISATDSMASQIGAWIKSDDVQAAISKAAAESKEWETEDSEEWETEDWDDIPIDTVQMVVESSKAAGAAPATAPAVPMAVPGRTSPAHARPLADADEAPFVARALREARAA